MRAVDKEHTSNSEGGAESGNYTTNGQSLTHPHNKTRVQLGLRTHESPVSHEEEFGERVERDVGARALAVVVRAGELGTGRRESTTGDEGVGQSGPGSRGSEHLTPPGQQQLRQSTRRICTLEALPTNDTDGRWSDGRIEAGRESHESGDPVPSLARSRERAANG